MHRSTVPRSNQGLSFTHARPFRTHVSGVRRPVRVLRGPVASADVQIHVAADGSTIKMSQPTLLVGSSGAADLRFSGSQVAERHAQLELKGGRLLCTALAAADPDNLLSPTYCWLNDVEQRPGVAYMVAPGSTLAFGSPDNTIRVEFEEREGAGSMAGMLLQGMLAGASQEVREQYNKLSSNE